MYVCQRCDKRQNASKFLHWTIQTMTRFEEHKLCSNCTRAFVMKLLNMPDANVTRGKLEEFNPAYTDKYKVK